MKKNIEYKFLESSNQILWHDLGNVEKEVLASLLEEGYKLGLKNNSEIAISYEKLGNYKKNESPFVDIKTTTKTFQQLKNLYKKINGENYSLKFEESRSKREFAFLEKEGEKRIAFGIYSWTMNYLKALEKEPLVY